MTKRKKIGIACGCRKLNYGSILQSYALCTFIQDTGYDCEFVWLKGSLFKHYNIRIGKIVGVAVNGLKHPTIIPKVLKSVKRLSSKMSSYSISDNNKALFEKFVKEYLTIKLFSWNELKRAEADYYKFVCGSDQIWNSYEYYLDPMYFLRFTSKDKRIAYAPSFGTDTISYYNKNNIKKYIEGFDNISVREESGRTICKQLLGKEVPIVVDPTLLLSKDEWKKKLDLKESDDDYCLVYFLNEPNPDAVQSIEKMRSIIKIKAIPINFSCYKMDEIVDAGPKEFLELLLNAKYILTDSFHGTIFSINYNKQFVCFERQYGSKIKQSSRITDTLTKFDLSGRYNVSGDKVLEVLNSTIDYDLINRKINDYRKESISIMQSFMQ